MNRWYEFHQGYRTVNKEDGTEERIAVLGEPFRDVSPGYLPRTLDELRAGRERSDADQQQHIVIEEDHANNGPSLEDTLDSMFEAAQAEETPQPTRTTPLTNLRQYMPEATLPASVSSRDIRVVESRSREYQNRRIAALRRELHRMRHGIERVIAGLRELGESVPDATEATTRLTDLGRTLDMISEQPQRNALAQSTQNESGARTGSAAHERGMSDIQHRIQDAQGRLDQMTRLRRELVDELRTAEANLEDARRIRDSAEQALETADSQLHDQRQSVSQLRREQRTAENYLRIFGSREDMERQGAEYESPIGGLFNRAMERFRAAEEVRREERTLRQVLEDEQRVLDAETARQSGQERPAAANTEHEDQLNEYYTLLRNQDWTQQPPFMGSEPNIPPNTLNAIRELDEEERIARLQYVASLVEQSQGSNTNASGSNASDPQRPEPERINILDRLLQNTAEPQRSAIVARMMENGTAQALQSVPNVPPSPLNLWRRLQEAQPPIAYESDSDSEPEENKGLDVEGDGRPEAKEDEELVLKMDCKICYTQVADTACLPCGHLVMCQWCSEQHSPVMAHDRTTPKRMAHCPVCRKRIKKKVRVIR